MTISKFLDPKNDVAFRRIFGTEQNKNILIRFLNDILGFIGNDQIEDVEFLSPIQDPDISSKKQSIVDVLCRDKKGVQIIVEMQIAPSKGFEKRAQYYAAKAYSRQLNKGQGEDGQYHNLKEVIFIAISDSIIFPDKVAYKSDHVILDQESKEHDLQDFSFTFIELPKFKKDRIEDLETIVEKWCYFFKHAEETNDGDLSHLIGSDIILKQAYEVVNQFNWTEKELIAYEDEVKRIWDNQAILDYQFDAGHAAGHAAGRAAGEEIGEQKALQKLARKLIAAGKTAQEVAMITDLSEQEVQEISADTAYHQTKVLE